MDKKPKNLLTEFAELTAKEISLSEISPWKKSTNDIQADEIFSKVPVIQAKPNIAANLPLPGSTPYTVAVDWFQVLVSGWSLPENDSEPNRSFDNGRICFYKRKKITPHFLTYYDIYIDGKPFCHALMHPRNEEIFGKDVIEIKVNNSRLYEVGWLDTFEYLTKKFTWLVKNVSRLDIALDGNGFMHVGNKLIKGTIRKVGRAEFAPRLTSKMEVRGYKIGRTTSDKCLVCYDKSAELEVSNKYYIREMWKRAGLDTSQRVERLELRLKNDAIKMVEDFDYRQLWNFEYLASIMRTNFAKFYEFYSPNKDTNVSRYKTYDYIKWEAIGGYHLPKLSAQQTDDVSRLKQTAKTLYGIYVQTGVIDYLQLSKEMALNANCVQWMIEKVDKWKEEFQRKLGKNPNGEIHYPHISSFTSHYKGEQLKMFSMIEDHENEIFAAIR